MSSVREYLKAREKRTVDKQGPDYREKIRSHRLAVFYRVVLVVVLITAVAAVLYVQWRDKIYTESTIVSSAMVDIVSGTEVENLDGNILLYSKDGASCMDTKGNAVWNQTYEMQNPMISVCEDVAAIGDYNGRTIYVMNKAGAMGEISTNMPIRSFCVSQNGVVAAVLDDVAITWIYLFDAQGNILVNFKTTMAKSGYPVDVSISPNGILVGISYLYVDSGELKSSIAFYNFGAVGQNEIENYVSGYDYLDTVAPVIQFMNNGAAFAVSDDRIMFFGGNERPTSVTECLLENEIKSIFYNENYIGLVYTNTTGESAYMMDIYNGSGTKVSSKLIDIEYSDIIFHKDQVIIYNDTDCIISNIKGADKYVGQFEQPATLLVPTSSLYKYVVVSPTSIDNIELH